MTASRLGLPQELPVRSIAVAAAYVLLVVAFLPGLNDLVGVWDTQEEYSFGYLIPFVALYLLWQRRRQLLALEFSGTWAGTALVAFSLVWLWIGRIATLDTVVQYAFLLSLYGVTLSLLGWRAFRAIGLPLAILLFMVPLPNYLLRETSAMLQLWSSQLGVAMIRAFGVSVFLEGNVIDLGSMRLDVAEACSGLRYLIPLMTLGFIAACLFRVELWKRVLVFVSTMPITLFMNSARIGLIGLLVELYGRSMAEGFLHDFEGWVIFMVCTATLLGEMALLTRLGPHPARLGDVFAPPPPDVAARPWDEQKLGKPFLAATALVAVAAGLIQLLPAFAHEAPPRKTFDEFPLAFDAWRGRADRLPPDILQQLRADDYLLADYVRTGSASPVNLYVSYYAAQADGNSTHSPRACIPGDGWEIVEFGERVVPAVQIYGLPLRVNRVVIRKGDNRALVYYWFQQRGRVTTDEYGVKLLIFWDAMTRHRSDGTMVRLVAHLRPGEHESAGDAVLEDFASLAVPRLSEFIPP